MKINTERDFWLKVRPRRNGCWEWTGCIHKSGYGMFGYNRKIHKTHRLAWIFTHGEIPKGEGYHGTCVCHKCDNPRCVNPEHLFLGSNHDNMLDRNAKGRNVDLRGRVFSEESKRKMSNSSKGKPKSKEHLHNLSLSLKGRTAWNKGLKLK